MDILDKKYKVGEEVNIIVRPENIMLFNNDKRGNGFKGVISDLIYDGYYTKVFVKYNKEIYKVITMGNDKLYKKGDEVYLYWALEDAIVLRCEDEKK